MSLAVTSPSPSSSSAPLGADPIHIADAGASADPMLKVSMPKVSIDSLPVGPALVIATTPKRGTVRKQPKEPATLYAYAVEQGGRIDLTAAAKAELVQRGLPEHRISNAAYGIRKCFGKTVTAIRSGRTVTAYQVQL